MEQTSKILNWIVKVAGMVICAPVTWLVAAGLFADVQPAPVRGLVQLAAVLLVEGVFLSNWLLLEYDDNAEPEVKARYALTALGMYIGVWVLAWQHGEGAAGLVFRAALGAALIGAGWDTYVVTWQKLTAKADRDVKATRAVRSHRRKLAVQDIKSEITLEYALRADDREKRKVLALEQRAQLQKRQEHAAKLEHSRELSALQPDSEQPSGKPSRGGSPKRGNYPYPVDRINGDRKLSKEQRIEQLQEHAAQNPEIGPTALVEWATSEFGVAKSTAWTYYNALQPEQLASNGNGHGGHS